MKPTLLIDGDVVLYTAASACEHEVRWDEWNHVLISNAEECFTAAKHIIQGHIDNLNANQEVYIALSGQDNFRKHIYPGYKASRGRKPLCYSRLIQMLSEEYTVRSQESLEGDDLLGLWQTSGKLGNTIIVSSDKDMLTIPGKIYRGGLMYDQSEHDANEQWMFQTLTGDSTDGYPGCPGVGKVKAEKLLSTCGTLEEMWLAVVDQYEKVGLSPEDALMQARLARILRTGDWNTQTKEVNLWLPK